MLENQDTNNTPSAKSKEEKQTQTHTQTRTQTQTHTHTDTDTHTHTHTTNMNIKTTGINKFGYKYIAVTMDSTPPPKKTMNTNKTK